MPKPIAPETYLRGAGLALKAGDKAEAAEFFLKAGEYETAALLFEQLEKHARAAAAYVEAGRSLDAAVAKNVGITIILDNYFLADGARDFSPTCDATLGYTIDKNVNELGEEDAWIDTCPQVEVLSVDNGRISGRFSGVLSLPRWKN